MFLDQERQIRVVVLDLRTRVAATPTRLIVKALIYGEVRSIVWCSLVTMVSIARCVKLVFWVEESIRKRLYKYVKIRDNGCFELILWLLLLKIRDNSCFELILWLLLLY